MSSIYWWKRRPMRRITHADYRHGYKFIKKTQPLLTKTKARAEGYKIESAPRLTRIKDKALWASRYSWVLSYKQTLIKSRGFKCELLLV